MSTDGQDTKCRRNIAENFNRLSRAHERYRQTTDRQRDGRQQIANVAKTHAFASLTLRDPFLTLVNSRISSKRNRCMSSVFDISITHARAHRSHMIAINRHRARSVTMGVNHGGRTPRMCTEGDGNDVRPPEFSTL